ncbi:MAG: diacylglycerol kinase family lipid kinase [Actinobacteria bacterium]|nr:diacylglycerol kinase family lipid kinase [Actinomycetota bacterium]
MVDTDGFTRTAKFLVQNRIYFDGVIEEQTNIREYISSTAALHLCNFVIANGKFSIEPALPTNDDGTLNEAATGLAGSDTALAVLPGGSTNVFARTIGLPNDTLEAAALMADALDEPAPRVGLGRVNGRYFCFHTGVGLDAAVVAAVERRAALKRWFGHPLFVWAALTTWARGYDRTRPHFSVSTEQSMVCDGSYFTVVLNTSPYTYLGNRPLDLVPGTSLDGGLGMISLSSLSMPTMLHAVRHVFSGNAPTGVDGVQVMTGLDKVVISRLEGTDDDAMPYQVDGDHLGAADRLEFEHVPDALRLVLPRATANPS